jgi:hypothetical protein
MKQTALQQLIKWGDDRLKNEPNKLLSFAEVIDKAEELLSIEREQIKDAFLDGFADAYNWPHTKKTSEDYFVEKYESK